MALGTSTNVVATGLYFEKVGPNDTLHCKPLGENNVRVSVNVMYSPDCNLPIPNAEMTTLKDAYQSHVAWPKKFVLLEDEV